MATERAVNSSASIARALLIFTVYFALAGCAMNLWPNMLAFMPILCCSFILSGFLNAAHDCVHSTHIRPKGLNRVLGTTWCTIILVNFTIYRQQHLVHHRFPGEEGDTEGHSKFETVGDYIRVQSGFTFWYAIFRRMVLTWRGKFPPSVLRAKRVRAALIDNLVLAAWLLAAATLTWFWPHTLLVFYWLPLLFYPPFALFFSLPEHLELTRPEVSWPRARDVRSNAIVRFFQWNANYHALHHRKPGIPAHFLHRVYARSDSSDDPADNSYLYFHAALLMRLWLGQNDVLRQHHGGPRQ